MKGWKTKLGATLLAIAAFLPMLGEEYRELGKAVAGLAAAITAVGIAHKVEKSGENK